MINSIAYFSLIIFLATTTASSQVNQEWLQRYNGPANSEDYANTIKVDEFNNIYVTGTSYKTGTGFDISTIKYNSSGAMQWIQIYNGQNNDTDEAYSITLDKIGNIYVTGFTKDDVAGFDFVTIKYNSSGVLEWVQTYNGTGDGNDVAISVEVDKSANVYVTGRSVGLKSNYDYVTIKYDSIGVQQWVQRYNGTANARDEAFTIAIDDLHNSYVTGHSEELGSSFDCVTIKYNSAGEEEWVRKYDGTAHNSDNGRFIKIDNDGNIYVAATTYRSVTFADYLLIKYNSLGVQQWAEFYDGHQNTDIISSMTIDQGNNIFITGLSYISVGLSEEIRIGTVKYNSSGAVQWAQEYRRGLYTLAFSMTTDYYDNLYLAGSSLGPSTGFDYLILKYSPTGIQQWEDVYNGYLNLNDYAKAIVTDAEGNVYVTGESFGNGTGLDYVTIKYSQQELYLNLTALFEGFYSPIPNTMERDTISVYLRDNNPPYSIIDSDRDIHLSSGTQWYNFLQAANGVNYYIVVKHRNSIETWSAYANSFSSNILNYDFTTSSSQAYGDNMKLRESRWTIYSGDINQDGAIDAVDLSLIDNDAYNYAAGYVPTDLNNNNFVDGADYLIADNNSYKFISVIRP